MAWTQEEIDAAYLKVRQLAYKDAKFRAELLKDPVKAIEKVIGRELAEDFQIKIIENDPDDTAALVLPMIEELELTDKDLDSIAGGLSGTDNSDFCITYTELSQFNFHQSKKN